MGRRVVLSLAVALAALLLAPAAVSASPGKKVDLQINLTATPDSVVGGEDVVLHAVVTNLGPHKAKDVSVSDTLPGGLVFDPNGSSGFCSNEGASVTCFVGDLKKHATADVYTAATPP